MVGAHGRVSGQYEPALTRDPEPDVLAGATLPR